jgi:hypothetical protein
MYMDDTNCNDQWNFHDESFDFDDGVSTKSFPSEGRESRQSSVRSEAEQELRSYMIFFTDPFLTEKINNVFQAHYNNPQVALQLCQYYYARTNLKSYTIKAELNRMNYTLILDHDTVLTSNDDIENWYFHTLLPLLSDDNKNPNEYLVHDMLMRCSNQSLLADVLEALTTDDIQSKCKAPLIRHRFQASPLAKKCRFVVDLRDPNDEASILGRHVQVDVTLVISIPTMQNSPNDRLDLASIRILIEFSPEPNAPRLSYSAVSIDPLLDVDSDIDSQKLHLAAMTINDHFALFTETTNDDDHSMSNSRDIFRDNFVKTHAGLTSALREIDNATNVSGKLNYLKSLTASLPTLSAAASEIVTAATTSGTFVQSSPLSSFENHIVPHFPPENPQTSSLHSENKCSRPPPVLGGLILSGLKSLAKAAILPDSSIQGIDEEKSHPGHDSVPLTSSHSLWLSSVKQYESFIPSETNPLSNASKGNMSNIYNSDAHSDEDVTDGWRDDDLSLQDDDFILQTIDSNSSQDHSGRGNLWARVSEDLDDLETKRFWSEVLEKIKDGHEDSEPENEVSPKTLRARYRTRAERLGFNRSAYQNPE